MSPASGLTRITHVKIQGISLTNHNFASSLSFEESKPEVSPVIVAEAGDLQIMLHARGLRSGRFLLEEAALVGLNRDELSRIEKGNTR